jgi:lipopolysaccharide transport system permease protein
MTATAVSASVTVIEPTRGWVPLRFGELWRGRELLYFLVWRDVKVRYKQAALGVLWAVLQPVLMMAVFSAVFGRMAGMPSDGLPYPVFTYCALLPWQLFEHALSESGNSVVNSQQLITKVYFPRLVIPLAAVAAGLVDFAIAFAVLLGLMLAYGLVPGPAALAVPGFVVMAVAAALGVGLWASALNVRYRDVRYTIPFVVQAWMFASPVVYPSSLVPEAWRFWYGLNPMAGVIEGFRWALLGAAPPSAPLLGASCLVTAAVLVTGLYYFRRMERTFADVV